jgi:hypothetical protein
MTSVVVCLDCDYTILTKTSRSRFEVMVHNLDTNHKVITRQLFTRLTRAIQNTVEKVEA